MRLPLPALALLLALLSPLSAHAQGGAFGLGPGHGSGSSSGTAGSSYTADPFVLDDGAGNVTYLSQGGTDGYVYAGTSDGALDGRFYAGAFGGSANVLQSVSGYWVERSGLGFKMPSDSLYAWSSSTDGLGTLDLYLRRSAASTLTVDSDGAGADADIVLGNGGQFILNTSGGVDTFLSTASSGQLYVGASTDNRNGGVHAQTFTAGTRLNNQANSTVLDVSGTNVAVLAGNTGLTTAAKLAVSGIAPMTSGQTLSFYEDDGVAAWTLDTAGKFNVAAGLGAISHIVGPSDQSLQFRAAASQSLVLGANSGAYTMTLSGSSNTATFTGVLLAPDGSNSAPAYSFSSGGSDDGFYYVGTDTVGWSMGGTVRGTFNPNGVTLGTGYVGWSNTATTAAYAQLACSAEGIVSLTNGTGTSVSSELRLQNAAESAYVGYRALTSSPDTTTPTLAALPTGGTAGQVGWLQVSINGTTSYIPYWQ